MRGPIKTSDHQVFEQPVRIIPVADLRSDFLRQIFHGTQRDPKVNCNGCKVS